MTVRRFHICAHSIAVSWLCLSLKPHFDAGYPKTELGHGVKCCMMSVSNGLFIRGGTCHF